MSVLDGIVARTAVELERRRRRVPLATLERDVKPSPRSLSEALRAEGVGLIAEFKPRSPSRGEIRPGARPAQIVPIYDRYASAMSVLVDRPHFGGGYDVLAEARALTERPILAKGFFVSRYQVVEARAAGADAVLLMASVLDDDVLVALYEDARALGMEALVEVHDDDELERVLALDVAIVGVNARDLSTLQIDLEAMLRRLDRVPAERVRVAESGVSEAQQVAGLCGRADAVLMGTALMAAPNVEEKIRELGWACA